MDATDKDLMTAFLFEQQRDPRIVSVYTDAVQRAMRYAYELGRRDQKILATITDK